MSFANPFTPSFGGLPNQFFGRRDLIAKVSGALDNGRSPYRSLFITGPRGCGKTALLERLSMLAHDAQWLTIDVHSSQAVPSIEGQLMAASLGISATVAPSLALPGGVSVSVGKTSVGQSVGDITLTTRLVQACESLVTHRGIFITVDEIQKISERDMEELCVAVQMAGRKGLPIAIMLAGLPESKELVASYKGCTFMQRVAEERLGSLLIDETTEAFSRMLALVPELDSSSEVVWELSSMSQGYPYLIQLVGYSFIERLGSKNPVGTLAPIKEDVWAVEETVYETYRANVLVPSLRGIKREGRAYLAVMSRLLDEDGIVTTRAIADAMGKSLQQLSGCRQMLLDRRLVMAVGRGKICYGLPYLSRFAVEGDEPLQESFEGRWIPR